MEEMETGLHAMSGELANTNERMAPIESAFTGAPGHPFSGAHGVRAGRP